MNRTHNNGELRKENIGEIVELKGWVAKKRNLGAIAFIDLRDRYGITQIVCDEEFEQTTQMIRNEFVIYVKGEVIERVNKNPNMPTGDIEIKVQELEIINTAKTTPLIIAEQTDALEEVRMKYRYLDLRRPNIQQKLITRHNVLKNIRRYLEDLDFVEVETPFLTKSTPEGARDFLVPARLHPGEFYALPQSPQLFKQLIMIAGFERYYQVAKCFRDEDLRADRQLEFTQVDIETSFLEQDEIQDMMEKMMVKVCKEIRGVDIEIPFKKMTYFEAMDLYGSDKPDTRFEMTLIDLKEMFDNTEFVAFQNKTAIKAINIKANASLFTRKKIDGLQTIAKKMKASGLAFAKMNHDQLEGSFIKFLSDDEKNSLIKKLNIENNDLILIIAGDDWEIVCNALGTVRLEVAKELNLLDKEALNFLWVNDFPMFEYDDETQRLYARHHPFTRPKKEFWDNLESKPLEIIADAYDLVLNGFEVAGGSLRTYSPELLNRVFKMLGFSQEQIEERFGFFINAFDYGTPPHGGIAIGFDRLSMIMTKDDNIREVIAFPKNANGSSSMVGDPSPVDELQLDELHIKVNKNK